MTRYTLLAAAVAVVNVLVLAVVRETVLAPLGPWWDTALTLALAGVLGAGLFWVVAGGVRRVRTRLARHGEKLVSAPAGELNREEAALPVHLQGIVDAARELTGAQRGTLELTEPRLTLHTQAAGSQEREGGRLLTALTERYQLHLVEVSSTPTPMSAPVVSRGQTIGTLTLWEKGDGLSFGPEDDALLRWCAMRVALCLEDDRRRRRMKEQAIAEERERIAREMHDSLAQVLGYINTKAQVVQELVRRGRAEQAAAQLAQLVQVAHTACGDVREEIQALRATPAPGESMLETLCAYLERWQQFTGVETHLEISTGGGSLPLAPEARLQLLRIIQAALSNVRKHAEAGAVRIRMQAGPEWLETTIEDDGIGFDTAGQGMATMPRFGLAMMRERAEAVSGELEVSSAPEEGTRVVARLPIDEGAKRGRIHLCES